MARKQLGTSASDSLDAATKGYSDAGSATLSNKTISGSSNTLSDIPLSALAATGTASASYYLRGDGTWASPTTLSGAWMVRTSTAIVNTSAGMMSGLPNNFWDTPIAATSDIAIDLTHGAFTVSVPGWYMVSVTYSIGSVPAQGNEMDMILYKNGTLALRGSALICNAYVQGTVQSTYLIPLDVNEFVQSGYDCSAAFGLTGEASGVNCYFSIARINPL